MLVELLAVFALLFSALSIGFVMWHNSQEKIRDEIRMQDLEELTQALVSYKQESGAYPATQGAWWGACEAYGEHSQSGANGWIPNLAPTYVPELPRDPAPRGEYGCYLYRSDGLDYKILIHRTIESLGSCPEADTQPVIPKEASYRDFFRSERECSISVSTDGARGW